MKLFILLFLVLVPCGAKAESIVVEAIGGSDSTLIHAGKSQALKLNDSLVPNDKIQVGKKAAVDLRLQNNSLVRVGAGTLLELKDNSLQLLSGSVRVLVPEKKANDKNPLLRFRLSTPEGSVGVRGTEFITDRMNSATTVHTLRGEVLFGASADFSNLAKFAVVMKGFESTIKTGETKPSSPKQFSMDEYLPISTQQSFSGLRDRVYGMQQPRSAVAQAQEPNAPANSPAPVSKPAPSKGNAVDSSSTQVNQNDLLITASANGDVVQMQKALQSGANPKTAIVPETGDSILHIAAVREHLEATQFVLDLVHIPVDYPNFKGQTALMECAHEASSQDIVLLLLQNGASRTVKDKAGHTALDYAKGNPNSKAMIQLLQSYSH